jgi:2-epi-5-epi-valiolone synthase
VRVMSNWLQCDKSRRFEVSVQRGLVQSGSAQLRRVLKGRRALIVTTPTVDKLYGPSIRETLASQSTAFNYEVMIFGETRKTLETVQHVCAAATSHCLGRDDILIAFGGGVCSDIVTLAASMIRRGIGHIRVPTTLVGQMDAGIGIKGGVNFHKKKNRLGCFHPPDAVLVDPSFLATLERSQILQGLAEIVKVALISDAVLFKQIQTHAPTLVSSRFQEPKRVPQQVLMRAIDGTLAELRNNPFEDQTKERLLDLGHTFSPSLEEATGFTLSHGEAVAIDLALTCMISAELNLMPASDANAVITLLQDIGLPISSPELSLELCREAIRHAVAHRDGALNLVVPTSIGNASFLRSPRRLSAGILDKSIEKLAVFANGNRYGTGETCRQTA